MKHKTIQLLGQPTSDSGPGAMVGIDNGVVAQGKITGVTGIGLAAPGTSPADQPIGVVGKGQTGVVGLGHQPEGTTPDSSVGVFGQGGVGVRGSTEGAGGIGVDGGSNDGIGVNGFSQTNDAVVGVSRGLRKSGVFGDNSQKGWGGLRRSVAEPIHLRAQACSGSLMLAASG